MLQCAHALLEFPTLGPGGPGFPGGPVIPRSPFGPGSPFGPRSPFSPLSIAGGMVVAKVTCKTDSHKTGSFSLLAVRLIGGHCLSIAIIPWHGFWPLVFFFFFFTLYCVDAVTHYCLLFFLISFCWAVVLMKSPNFLLKWETEPVDLKWLESICLPRANFQTKIWYWEEIFEGTLPWIRLSQWKIRFSDGVNIFAYFSNFWHLSICLLHSESSHQKNIA